MVRKSSQASQYRQKSITVSAIQWDPEMGAKHGVQAKPKKHEMNPDDFYVKTRFGKEIPVVEGDWIITYLDGSSDVVKGNSFTDLYEPVKAKKEKADGGADA